MMNASKPNNNETDLINWIEEFLERHPEKHMAGFHETEGHISVEFPIIRNDDYTTPLGVILIAGVRVFITPKSSPTGNVPATVLLDDGEGHSSIVQTQAKIKVSSNKFIQIDVYWCDFDNEPNTKYGSTILNGLVITLTTDEYSEDDCTVERKYELTDEIRTQRDRDGRQVTMYRIKSLKNFSDVKIGDLGGWVESYDNLSHEGNCWIYDEASAIGNAKIIDNATLRDRSVVMGNAKVCGDSELHDNSHAVDNATISGNVKLFDSVVVFDDAVVRESATLRGSVFVYGTADVSGNSTVSGDLHIHGNVKVVGRSNTSGSVTVLELL